MSAAPEHPASWLCCLTDLLHLQRLTWAPTGWADSEIEMAAGRTLRTAFQGVGWHTRCSSQLLPSHRAEHKCRCKGGAGELSTYNVISLMTARPRVAFRYRSLLAMLQTAAVRHHRGVNAAIPEQRTIAVCTRWDREESQESKLRFKFQILGFRSGKPAGACSCQPQLSRQHGQPGHAST